METNPIGMCYELAGTGNADNMALRPYLLEPDGFKEWGREVVKRLDEGLHTVSFHRPYGEKHLGNGFDWHTRRYLTEHDEARFGEYANNFDLFFKHVMTAYPATRFIVYHGGMVFESDMLMLDRIYRDAMAQNDDEGKQVAAGAIREFNDLVMDQIGAHVALARRNPNVWIGFDFSVTYEVDSLPWQAVMATRAMLAGRVLIESIPHPDRPHTHGLPAMAGERDYQAKITDNPDRIKVCGEVVRWTQGEQWRDNPHLFAAAALHDGHIPLVSDTSMGNMSVAELVSAAQDVGDPQGAEG